MVVWTNAPANSLSILTRIYGCRVSSNFVLRFIFFHMSNDSIIYLGMNLIRYIFLYLCLSHSRYLSLYFYELNPNHVTTCLYSFSCHAVHYTDILFSHSLTLLLSLFLSFQPSSRPNHNFCTPGLCTKSPILKFSMCKKDLCFIKNINC